MTRQRNTLIISMAAAGMLVSLYLFWSKITSQFYCPIGDCSVVNNSRYAYIGPFPVSLMGISYYCILILLMAASRRGEYTLKPVILRLYIWAGFGYSTYLTGVEAFVLRAVCIWCVISYVLMIGITVVSSLNRPLFFSFTEHEANR